MCLNRNGKYLLFTTGLRTAIFDLRLMEQSGQTKESKDIVINVGFSFDGSKVFLAYINNIVIYNPTNWVIIKEFAY